MNKKRNIPLWKNVMPSHNSDCWLETFYILNTNILEDVIILVSKCSTVNIRKYKLLCDKTSQETKGWTQACISSIIY